MTAQQTTAHGTDAIDRLDELLASMGSQPPNGGHSTPSAKPARDPMAWWERTAIGWLIIAFSGLLFTQLLAIWPAAVAATNGPDAKPPVTPLFFGIKDIEFTPEVAMILMVAMVGTLGSLVELIRWFTTHAGRGELSTRWTWWYALRPVQGGALAVVVYFMLRGGLLNAQSADPLSPYGVAAFAGLVGLFTRHAVKKLKEIFDASFGPPNEDENIDPQQ